MLTFNEPITNLQKVTPALTKKFASAGIETVRDLLYCLPLRYEDFSVCKKVEELTLGEEVTVKGKITQINSRSAWRGGRKFTEIYVADDTGTIKAVWFHFFQPLTYLKEGKYIRLSGKTSLSKTNELQFQHPNFELISKRQIRAEEEQVISLDESAESGVLVPVYPERKGLKRAQVQTAIREALKKTQVEEFLPRDIRESQKLLGLEEALKKIHNPASHETLQAAKQRLAFEKMFLVQLRVLQAKQDWETQKAVRVKFDQTFIQNLVKKLPFDLTGAQKKATWQIIQDLEKSTPMNRLLEGDVGCGKTVVAALALALTAHQGFQAAFLAPTEILATQHFQGIRELTRNTNFKLGLLTGSQSQIDEEETSKPKLKKNLQTGKLKLVVGTHALLQKSIEFENLALVIIDEQHRFGVGQRAFLQQQTQKLAQIEDYQEGIKNKDQQKNLSSNLTKSPESSLKAPEPLIPHLLTMTATPIPRTLSLAIFGDLELSVIDEYPQGRKKIVTQAVPPQKREEIYQFCRSELQKGRQIFVICPLVEESESLAGVKSVKSEFERIQKQIFPRFRVGLLHGKMKAKEKDQVMTDFKKKELEILVSTSVVEVGVDVPNATVMIIEGSERFGLSQLHQFRGRVGRGAHQSYCFLFTSDESSSVPQRLKAMEKTNDGFQIAQYDLNFRGPGQFLGSNQSGPADLAMEALSDVQAIAQIRLEAQRVLGFDPALEKFPLLQERLKELERTTHFE